MHHVPVTLRGGNREFYNFTGREAIVSGPAETGKTFAGLLKLHTLAGKYPGCQLAIMRKVYADLVGTALQTYRRDILRIASFKHPHPQVKVYGGNYPQWFDYPNGVRIWAGGLDNPGKTLSGERDVIYVVQAEQLTASDWEFLMRSTTGRGAVMPYTQLLGDCNPGNQNHWILQRESLRLFTTTHRDNPTLYDANGNLTAQGERTLTDLASLTGARYKRLYQGLWSAPEGMIYDVFDSDRHVIEPFDIPDNWPRIVGIDPYGDVVAALWLAYNPADASLHCYREYAEHFGQTTQGHADNILALSGNEPIFYYCGGGPGERQQRADFAGYGIPLLEPAIGSVWAQIDRVYGLLKSDRLFFHRCKCPQVVSELGEYHRKSKGGVVQDNTIADKEQYHALDALRYAITGPDVSGTGARRPADFHSRTGLNY